MSEAELKHKVACVVAEFGDQAVERDRMIKQGKMPRHNGNPYPAASKIVAIMSDHIFSQCPRPHQRTAQIERPENV